MPRLKRGEKLMKPADTEIYAELEKTTARLDAAWNMCEATDFSNFWVENGTNITPMGDVMEGRAVIEKNMRMMFSSTTKRMTHKLTIEKVYSVSPFIAVADGIAEVSAAHDVWKSRFTAIFSKLNDGDWKIEHMRSYVFSK
jgi:uncharacterized protein (TIGR02246 family)